MTTFGHIGGAEPSTLTFKVATITQTRNSSAMQQEILSIGDPNSSAAIAECSSAIPTSTFVGLVTKEAGGFLSSVAGKVTVDQLSTTWQVQIHGDSTSIQGTSPWVVAYPAGYISTSALTATSSGLSVRAVIDVIAAGAGRLNVGSTAADNAVLATIASFPAGNISSAALVATSSGLAVRAVLDVISAGAGRINIGSTAADNVVTVSGYSTIVSVAAWPPGMLSTAAPSSNTSGVTVRQVIDNIITVASTNALASTSFAINSSVANAKIRVVAYSITSTLQTPTSYTFYSSGNVRWPVRLAALSSAVSGANLACAAPGYLFASNAGEALTLQTKSTITNVNVAVSFFIGI